LYQLGDDDQFRPVQYDFDPSPEDRRWASAAARRNVWTWDRASRWTALCERLEDVIRHLERERCDVPRDDRATRAGLDRRLFLSRERLNRFRVKARALRRTARVMAAHAEMERRAGESAALDAMSGYHIPRAPWDVEEAARAEFGSQVGHADLN